MFENCHQMHIFLNLQKLNFFVPFENLLGHIVFHDEMLVYPTDIVVTTKIEKANPKLNELEHLKHLQERNQRDIEKYMKGNPNKLETCTHSL